MIHKYFGAFLIKLHIKKKTKFKEMQGENSI